MTNLPLRDDVLLAYDTLLARAYDLSGFKEGVVRFWGLEYRMDEVLAMLWLFWRIEGEGGA